MFPHRSLLQYFHSKKQEIKCYQYSTSCPNNESQAEGVRLCNARVSVCYPMLDKPTTALSAKVKEKAGTTEEMPGCQGELDIMNTKI